jgi:hypothetical protein
VSRPRKDERSLEKKREKIVLGEAILAVMVLWTLKMKI